jgi:hypothetical protein
MPGQSLAELFACQNGLLALHLLVHGKRWLTPRRCRGPVQDTACYNVEPNREGGILGIVEQNSVCLAIAVFAAVPFVDGRLLWFAKGDADDTRVGRESCVPLQQIHGFL